MYHTLETNEGVVSASAYGEDWVITNAMDFEALRARSARAFDSVVYKTWDTLAVELQVKLLLLEAFVYERHLNISQVNLSTEGVILSIKLKAFE